MGAEVSLLPARRALQPLTGRSAQGPSEEDEEGGLIMTMSCQQVPQLGGGRAGRMAVDKEITS